MGFLELRQARAVYSRVTTGMPILNGSLFSEVRVLSFAPYVLGSSCDFLGSQGSSECLSLSVVTKQMSLRAY